MLAITYSAEIKVDQKVEENIEERVPLFVRHPIHKPNSEKNDIKKLEVLCFDRTDEHINHFVQTEACVKLALLGNKAAKLNTMTLANWSPRLIREVPEALEWFHDYSNHGNKYASYSLGKLYHLGMSSIIDADHEKAEHYLTLASNQGEANALNYLLKNGFIDLNSLESKTLRAKTSNLENKNSINPPKPVDLSSMYFERKNNPDKFKTSSKTNPSIGEKSVDFDSYIKKLQFKIKNNWNPPNGANNTSKVVLLFQIFKDGRLGDIKTQKEENASQEYTDLAYKALKDTAPFEPLPTEYPGKSIDVQFVFDYTAYQYNYKGKKKYYLGPSELSPFYVHPGHRQ